MAQSPPRLLQKIGGERVLLVDSFQPTRDPRTKVLRAHGIDVDAAENLDEARVYFQSSRYDLVLLNLRRYPPAEALVFCRVVRDINPDQRIAFLLGPPMYLTTSWPEAFAYMERLSDHRTRAKRHVAAA
jgi:response regulator RpfG family c-di-GMP phosphodiesterase